MRSPSLFTLLAVFQDFLVRSAMRCSFRSLFIVVVALSSTPALIQAAPNAPTALNLSSLTTSSVRLAWTDNSTNEAGFIIGQRLPPSTSFTILGSVAANATSVNIPGLIPNTNYEYVVVAYDAANDQSPLSNIVRRGVGADSYSAALIQAPFSLPLNFSPQATSYTISSLPPGLTLNPTTGVITGTPTSSGKTIGTVTVTYGTGLSFTTPLTIRVFVNPPALQAPTAGPALPALTVPLATSPGPISFASLFTDPDVSTAARVTTDLGPIDFAFYPGSAPATVANFLGYMNRGDFNNTIFHRSARDILDRRFVIQGGAFRADATGSSVPTQPPVVNEPNITNLRGTVSMAKIGGNPNSATNQFFINSADNAFNLDNQNEGFTVFARVAGNGMAVADAIADLPRTNYSNINGAFGEIPYRGSLPPAYDPTTLVRISNVAPVAPLTYSVASSAPTIATASLTGTDLTFSPLNSGTSTITLTATDLDNQTATSSFLLTVTDAYDQWATTESFPAPADALPGADPDNDGLINLTEFALPSAPLAATASNTIPTLTEGHLTLAFPLRSPLTGTVVTLQSAATPAGPWTDRWSSTDGLTHPWIASHLTTGDTIQITAKDPAPLNPDNRFLRLKITRP